MSRITVRLEFKLQDMWVGWFWRWTHQPTVWESHIFPLIQRRPNTLDVWICFPLPMIPVHVRYQRGPKWMWSIKEFVKNVTWVGMDPAQSKEAPHDQTQGGPGA